jgi:SagB-type dehydrogenase family enzyme
VIRVVTGMRVNSDDAARLYHLNSSYVRDRLVEPPADEDRRPYRFRTYPGSPRVDLPGRDFRITARIGDVLRRRRSARNLSLRPLDLARVGRLLHSSYGVKGFRNQDGESIQARPCPSAGALYPLELYVATRAVTGLSDGLYHYDARAHQLETRHIGSMHPGLAALVIQGDQEVIRNANLVITISAVFERTCWKYGERGYRYVWLEAGHVGQNLYLAATALGLGSVSLGGFFDEELNRFLNLPPGEEHAMYILCIGHSRNARK